MYQIGHDSEQPLGLTNVRFQTGASCNQKYPKKFTWILLLSFDVKVAF